MSDRPAPRCSRRLGARARPLAAIAGAALLVARATCGGRFRHRRRRGSYDLACDPRRRRARSAAVRGPRSNGGRVDREVSLPAPHGSGRADFCIRLLGPWFRYVTTRSRTRCCFASFAIRSSFVDTVTELGSLPYFPRSVPCSGASFPPRGPLGWFPRFLGTMRRSDFLPSFPGHFVAFVPRYRRCALVRSCRHEHDTHRPGAGHRVPPSGFVDGDDRISQVPGEPLHACPVLRPRWDLRARPLPRFGAAFRNFDGVGSHVSSNFGAQSHGPHARCLRFAGWVAPAPRKTRFRLPGQALPGGRWLHPLGSIEGFCFAASSFSKLSWRTEKLL